MIKRIHSTEQEIEKSLNDIFFQANGLISKKKKKQQKKQNNNNKKKKKKKKNHQNVSLNPCTKITKMIPLS